MKPANPTARYRDCAKAYFNGQGRLDPARREELILAYTPLIKYMANRLAARLPASVAVDDLVSAGIIGLIDAIDKFDVSKEVQFKTYAEFRIRGAMLDELRALDWVPRSVRRKLTELEHAHLELEKQFGRTPTDEEMAARLGLDLEGYYRLLDETKAVTFIDIEILRQRSADVAEGAFGAILSDDDPYAALGMSEMRDLVAATIAGLPEKEKLVVALYYFEELTMKEIGLVMGYTESRISQLHSKAMLRLRARLRRALEE